MDGDLYPPTQLYLPLALCLTFLSIVASAVLSSKVPERLKGTVVPKVFLIALVTSFAHIVLLTVASLAEALSTCDLGSAGNLLVHLIVIISIGGVAVPLAGKISKHDVDSAKESLTVWP